MPAAAGPGGGSGGFALALLTESFAVRALLGSVVAAALAALAVRRGMVAGSDGRRLLVLTPPLVAAAAAVATALGSAAYLPQLWLIPEQMTSLSDAITGGGSRDLLLVAYTVIAGALLTRRALGLLTLRRTVARGCVPGPRDRRAAEVVALLAPRMGLATPRLVLVRRCPGGAFAAGLFRPLVAVDPALAADLDDRELEGLLAHELAHLRRRDPLLRLVVGAFRDLTFFLPTVSLATRWLGREQEESADEVAARATGRPGALASSILVVWQRAGAGLTTACAAVPARPRLALSGGPNLVELRVERLLAGQRQLSRTRATAELALAAAVLSVGLVAALTVPRWIVERTDGRDELWASILTGTVPATAGTQESPAFAAFRAGTATVAADTAPATAVIEPDECPCVETQAQLREGVAAVAPATPSRLRWSPDGEQDFRLRTAPRPLLELRLEQGARVGVFLVEGSRER